jgi:phosphoglycolate phosphatase-like HAD superfamily hydrolase
MNYTTYLFDFDYTLADSSRGIVTCFHNVLTRHGYTEVTDDDIKRTIGKTLEDSFSILTGVTDAGQLAGFKAEYRKEADTHMTVNTVLFLETKSVLTALKDSGARIGIISTKYRFRIKELLNQHFPEDFMDIIVGGEDVKAAKPSPEGLLLAIKRLHVSKAETLYIGDSTVDAETAQAAGVDFAGVTHGVTTAKELEKYPHRKIMNTLEELLAVQEEHPSIFKIENPIRPENAHATSPRKQKRISVWQILLLVTLFWLAIEELDMTDDSNFFPVVFILTLWSILQKRRILPNKARTFIDSWWHPCAVRLRAFHIKLIQGRKTPPAGNETCTCLNCGTTYTGNYCNRCGQSRNTPRYRLSNALKNIAGGFFNIDNGFGRTLLELLYRPGYMIRDFIGGKRVEYFRPFQTLFILAALYIMAVQLVDPEALSKKEKTEKTEQTDKEEIIAAKEKLTKKMEKTYSKEEKRALAITIKSLEKSLNKLEEKNDSTSATQVSEQNSDDGDLIDEFVNDTSEVGDRLEKVLQNSPFLMKVWNLMKSWGHGNKAFRIIATLPLFALATQLAFRRRKYKLNYNTTEHVFIQAYIACQILLLSIIVLPFNGYAKVDDLYELPLWLIFVLFCWDYKQLYRCTWWRSFWRTILMLTYSLVLLVIFACLVMALMLAGIYVLKFIL